MGSIEKHIDKERELTVYTVTGQVSVDTYAKNIHDFYAVGPVTRNVIWDLTESDLEHFRSEDVQNLGKSPKKFTEERSRGKTAIVAPTDLSYGFARMYEFTADLAEVSIELKVLRSFEEAIQWLEPGT